MKENKNLKVLALDLSTSVTGWAVFNGETEQIIQYGQIKSSAKGRSKMCKLEKTLTNMQDMAYEIEMLVNHYEPYKIVIEEITGSKNYLGQKTLDGFHWIVLNTIQARIDDIIFYPVSGTSSWRRDLQFRLTENDKTNNKESKKLNKKIKESQKLPMITQKHLACRYVKWKFGLDLDPHKENDMADAIAMGHAFIRFRFTKYL